MEIWNHFSFQFKTGLYVDFPLYMQISNSMHYFTSVEVSWLIHAADRKWPLRKNIDYSVNGCLMLVTGNGSMSAFSEVYWLTLHGIIIVYLVYEIALEWDGSLSDRMIWLPVNCPRLIAYDNTNDYCVKGSFCVRVGTAGDGVTCNVVSRWLGPHTEWPLVCCCLPGWHGARLGSCWPQVGPMLAPWDLLSG